MALSLFLIQTTPCTGKTCIFSCRKIPLERIALLVTPLQHKVCKYQFAFNKDSNCIVEKNDVDRSTTRRELAYQLTCIYLSSSRHTWWYHLCGPWWFTLLFCFICLLFRSASKFSLLLICFLIFTGFVMTISFFSHGFVNGHHR